MCDYSAPRWKTRKKAYPITKVFKEDWRTIFECLERELHLMLEKSVFTEKDKYFIRRRVALCRKILPKFISIKSMRYSNCDMKLQQILTSL